MCDKQSLWKVFGVLASSNISVQILNQLILSFSGWYNLTIKKTYTFDDEYEETNQTNQSGESQFQILNL